MSASDRTEFDVCPRRDSYFPETHEPSMGEKISGQVEQVVGKMTNNPDKILEGESKKTGQPISESTLERPEESHPSSSKNSFNDNEEEVTPINPDLDRNTNVETQGAHHRHDRKSHERGEDIPPPPPDINPYAIAPGPRHPRSSDIRSNENTKPNLNLESSVEKATEIPLPPSHQISFAYHVPPTPDAKGDKSSGYLVHGGLPSSGQGLSDTGLGKGEGGVLDRTIVQPPMGNNV
ncbi:uncharacterized protein I303_105496 [Kwoniella dejecticola CBS 10117]|uniref:Uncharacterized protein n=1 Tax=Kwoniella dejecticola CBS 10117 TaxID=1296121 RepID=A0A1A6A2D5_9TREE|nr:uncharacterized protein I303_05061 [Kwoniella dejecticola CBS 10117]OBR84204.1 hypothetical protein I303_05061 [Kwoniella dejecticola CBS 10117]